MSVWDGQREAMRLMMPVLMRKKQMEREDQQMQMQLQTAQLKLEQDRADKAEQLLREEENAQVKYEQGMLKSAYEKGDVQGVQAFGDPLAQRGMPVPAQQVAGPPGADGLPPLQYFAAPQAGPKSFQEAILQHPELQGASVPDLQGAYQGLQRPPAPTEWGLQYQAAQGNELAQATLEAKAKRDRDAKPQDLEPKDEFNRNLKRLIKLEEEGKQNTTEYRELAKRIAKQNEGAGGIALQVGDDGSISFAQGPGAAEGLGTALTGKQAIDQQEKFDRYSTTIDTIDNVTRLLKEDTSRSGVTGSIRSFAQRVMGVANDATPTQIAEAAKVTISQMKGIPDEQRENISAFFDPSLSELEIYQNTIALELAKLRVTAGGGGIRAMESAFKDARKDAAIFSQRGKMLFSTQEALVRYETIKGEFETERSKLKKRLGGGEGKPKVIKYDAQGNRIQ